MTYLVVGASGNQGGAVARELLSRGQQVRCFTRDPSHCEDLKKMGAEIVVGNLSNHESIRHALQGVTGAFLITTWYEEGPEKQAEQGRAFIKIAGEVGLPHLVLGSVRGAGIAPQLGGFEANWKLEQELHVSGLEWTVVRPVWYMENFGGPWFEEGLANGVFAIAMPEDAHLGVMTLGDYGRVCTEALFHPEKYAGKTIEVSAEELTIREIMTAIEAHTGKQLTYQRIPDEAVLEGFGEQMLFLLQWFTEVKWDQDPQLKQLGLEMTTLDDYLASAPWVASLVAK